MTVDDVEAGPDSVEVNPQVYVALAELLEGEALDTVKNTTRGAGLEARPETREKVGPADNWTETDVAESHPQSRNSEGA